MDVQWLNWAIMLASFAALIWLGFKSSATVHEGDDAEEGFLVAGRSLGAFVGASTIVATGFSGWGFMGSPGVAYEFGAIEVLGNFFFAPAMVIAVLFFANYLAKRAEHMGSCTIPEYAARLHGDGGWARVVHSVAAIITIVLLLVFLTSQIKAVGLLAAGLARHLDQLGSIVDDHDHHHLHGAGRADGRGLDRHAHVDGHADRLGHHHGSDFQ